MWKDSAIELNFKKIKEQITNAANEKEKEKEKAELEMRNLIIPAMMGMFQAARRVKSIRRSIKRGKLTMTGVLVAKRPFNNRKNTSERKGVNSRFITALKKRDYEYAKRRAI